MTNERIKNAILRAEQKSRVVSVAMQAFAADGIRSITMDDIANRMGMSKHTLYELFADKEALLEECIKRGHQEEEAYLRNVQSSARNVLEVLLRMFLFSIERFHSVNKKFFDEIKRYPKAYARLMSKRQTDSEGVFRFFREGVSQGIFRPDVNYSIALLLLHKQLDMLMDTDISREFPFIDVYESIMFTFLRGISTESGARELDRFMDYYRGDKHPSEQ